MRFQFADANALDRSDMCLRVQRRFTAVFSGGKHCKKVLEDVLGAPASSYEALLLSAGKRGQSPSKRPYQGKIWVCQRAPAWSLHTNTQSHLYKSRHLGAVSSSTSLSEAGPHQRLLV